MDAERVTYLRNELTLWAMGKNVISLTVVQAHMIELDRLLQQFDF